MTTCECCQKDEATTKMVLDGQEIDACEECADREAEFMELDALDADGCEYY